MPTASPNRPPRRARKKVTTDLGRQLLTRERQRLSREQAALAEQQLNEAEARRTQQKRNTKSHKPLDIAVSRSIVKRFSAVLASEGLSVRIIATPATETSAWTDFEQIVINYQQQDDDRILAANMRGLAYHEGGHCRWTVPFMDLAQMAGLPADRELHTAWNCLEDQRMETAVVTDSPRKAAYLTPMVMLDLVPSVSHAAANWPLLIWRRYLPKHIRTGARKLFVAKHVAANIDGEALAKAFEATTTKYVLADNAVTMMEAVVEYHGLLGQCLAFQAPIDDRAMGHQRQYRREGNLDDYLVIPVDGGMEGEGQDDEGDEPEYDLTDPEVAKHLTEVLIAAWNAPETLIAIVYASTSGSGESSEGSKDKDQPKQPAKPSQPKDDESDDDDEGDDEAEGDEAGDAGRDDDGMEYANEAPSETDGAGDSGSHKNTGVRDDLDYKPEDDDDASAIGSKDDEDEDIEGDDDAADDEADTELSDDDLAEALAEAEEERSNDPSLDGDVQSLHEAINNKTSDLMPYNAGISVDNEAKAQADYLASEVERCFNEATVERNPGWVEGSRRGVVNVLRYETRRPGNVEFFRQWTETEAPGRNIAVSLLLDYSGSMGGSTKELAQMGYACKVACQNLDIPCTVTLWDTDATTLFDAVEYVEHLPVIVSAGGTDPSVALADLDNQRYDKDIHLVIIMTDGAWSAQPGMVASYNGDRPGRHFIGVGYAASDWGGGTAEAMAENLRRYGCDESHGVDDLMEVPRYLEQALIAFG